MTKLRIAYDADRRVATVLQPGADIPSGSSPVGELDASATSLQHVHNLLMRAQVENVMGVRVEYQTASTLLDQAAGVRHLDLNNDGHDDQTGQFMPGNQEAAQIDEPAPPAEPVSKEQTPQPETVEEERTEQAEADVAQEQQEQAEETEAETV